MVDCRWEGGDIAIGTVAGDADGTGLRLFRASPRVSSGLRQSPRDLLCPLGTTDLSDDAGTKAGLEMSAVDIGREICSFSSSSSEGKNLFREELG